MKTARHSDSLLLDEARKHLAFREVWVALALTLVYFAVFAKPMSDVETRWLITQNEIYRMGNIGVAFMLITTLPRLVTCVRHPRAYLRIPARGEGHFPRKAGLCRRLLPGVRAAGHGLRTGRERGRLWLQGRV